MTYVQRLTSHSSSSLPWRWGTVPPYIFTGRSKSPHFLRLPFWRRSTGKTFPQTQRGLVRRGVSKRKVESLNPTSFPGDGGVKRDFPNGACCDRCKVECDGTLLSITIQTVYIGVEILSLVQINQTVPSTIPAYCYYRSVSPLLKTLLLSLRPSLVYPQVTLWTSWLQ